MSRKPKNNQFDKEDALFNNKLKQLSPKTDGQKEFIRAICESRIVFCTGPAGSGKSHCSIGMGVDRLSRGLVKNLVLTRPVLEAAGDKLGFLPGTLEEKIHPYLIPLFDELLQYFNHTQLNIMLENGKTNRDCGIRIIPLAYMRGINLHDCFVIADEFQNATMEQIKLLITRLGRNSQIIISGDIEQSDLPDKIRGGLKYVMSKLAGFEEIGIVQLTKKDIVRDPFIAKILERLDA